MRSKGFLGVTLALLATTWAGCLPAQERGTNSDGIPVAAFRSPNGQTVPFGVPLAPPIYFVNFLFLYFANPATAALMPAYRVPLPSPVYNCLLANPDGCPYEQMAPFFRKQANDRVARSENTNWPRSCETTPQWQPLAPPVYQRPDQINEPLGQDKADQLAQALGISQDIVLSPAEYACVMGVPMRDPARQDLYVCFIDFTASKGNGVVVPFSSYGLNLNEKGNVLSLCAPHAPCLEANHVFTKLNEIAGQCKFTHKLERLLIETDVLQFIAEGARCQSHWAGACIAETTRSHNDSR
jgi:hypothetical protein